MPYTIGIPVQASEVKPATNSMDATLKQEVEALLSRTTFLLSNRSVVDGASAFPQAPPATITFKAQNVRASGCSFAAYAQETMHRKRCPPPCAMHAVLPPTAVARPTPIIDSPASAKVFRHSWIWRSNSSSFLRGRRRPHSEPPPPPVGKPAQPQGISCRTLSFLQRCRQEDDALLRETAQKPVSDRAAAVPDRRWGGRGQPGQSLIALCWLEAGRRGGTGREVRVTFPGGIRSTRPPVRRWASGRVYVVSMSPPAY